MLFRKAMKKQIDRIEKKYEQKRKVSHAFTLKRKRCSQREGDSLDTPMNRESKRLSGKVSFCAHVWKRASLTLETAMVLPLFLLGMLTMISFLDIYRQQTVHLTDLCQKAKQSGMYAYMTAGNGPQEITLPDVYSYQPLGGLLPLRKVWTLNQVKVHTWTGRDSSSWNVGDGEEVEEMVYVTASGEVYHTDADCTYLKLSVSTVSGSTVSSLRNNHGEKYHACEICSRNQSPAGAVYITGEGNRYHNHAECSGLKRTVRLVCKSDLGEMCACSRCSG